MWPNSVIHRNSTTTEVGFGRIIELILGLPLKKVNSFAMAYISFAGWDTSPLSGLTKKAEPAPTSDVNRDSGTTSANGCRLRRLDRG